MNLQNFTYNVNPFLPMGNSPFHHTAVPQVNNMYYNAPPSPTYSPDYNSPNRHQTQLYNNPRIEPYQKPDSNPPQGYANPANNALPGPQYSSQGKGPDPNYPYYQQNPSSYPAPKDNVQYSQPAQVPPALSNKRIPPPPPPPPSTTSRPQYTRVEGSSGSKTSVHAILDYDDDFEEYYDEDEYPPPHNYKYNHVTPIQGPITLRNGSVPVVPLYSYDTVNNGSLLQIPVSNPV
ncbi:extensin-2-like [Diaphorina citri]|uniref:Extensin-2-like n=1 Tax=Diaphorina citri TaxID=121845 RepID=A0A1S3DB20_DIACI|nr:extensin-2-like [Diaphorina citri]